MRIENYEILKSNQWCYQVYKVMPDGWDGKQKTRNRPNEENPLGLSLGRVFLFHGLLFVACCGRSRVQSRVSWSVLIPGFNTCFPRFGLHRVGGN